MDTDEVKYAIAMLEVGTTWHTSYFKLERVSEKSYELTPLAHTGEVGQQAVLKVLELLKDVSYYDIDIKVSEAILKDVDLDKLKAEAIWLNGILPILHTHLGSKSNMSWNQMEYLKQLARTRLEFLDKTIRGGKPEPVKINTIWPNKHEFKWEREGI